MTRFENSGETEGHATGGPKYSLRSFNSDDKTKYKYHIDRQDQAAHFDQNSF
jgi:hypothetical protein